MKTLVDEIRIMGANLALSLPECVIFLGLLEQITTDLVA